LKLTLTTQNSKVYYNLYAVLNHIGELESGHYTSYCKNSSISQTDSKFMNENGKVNSNSEENKKNKEEDEWIEFDDNKVKYINENKIVTNKAYVLFYQRESIELLDSSSQHEKAAEPTSKSNESAWNFEEIERKTPVFSQKQQETKVNLRSASFDVGELGKKMKGSGKTRTKSRLSGKHEQNEGKRKTKRKISLDRKRSVENKLEFGDEDTPIEFKELVEWKHKIEEKINKETDFQIEHIEVQMERELALSKEKEKARENNVSLQKEHKWLDSEEKENKINLNSSQTSEQLKQSKKQNNTSDSTNLNNTAAINALFNLNLNEYSSITEESSETFRFQNKGFPFPDFENKNSSSIDLIKENEEDLNAFIRNSSDVYEILERMEIGKANYLLNKGLQDIQWPDISKSQQIPHQNQSIPPNKAEPKSKNDKKTLIPSENELKERRISKRQKEVSLLNKEKKLEERVEERREGIEKGEERKERKLDKIEEHALEFVNEEDEEEEEEEEEDEDGFEDDEDEDDDDDEDEDDEDDGGDFKTNLTQDSYRYNQRNSSKRNRNKNMNNMNTLNKVKESIDSIQNKSSSAIRQSHKRSKQIKGDTYLLNLTKDLFHEPPDDTEEEDDDDEDFSIQS
jgi:hypothetical protein